jgi:hypothetical protein
MEKRTQLIQDLIKKFLIDLNECAKPLTQEENINFMGILIEYLKGVYNFEPSSAEYNYEGYPFDEDEFIEIHLLKPYRHKMVPFIKTRLRYYFAKDEHIKTMLFQKLNLNETTLNDDEYQMYIMRIYLILRKIKENLYLKPIETMSENSSEAQTLIESPDELIRQGFKSKSKEYTRIRQMLLFYFVLKLMGLSRLDTSARKYAQFAHFLFYYPTDNIDGSEVYKMLKQAPYVKENKPLLKELDFVKKQFELIDCEEGIKLVQKEIDLIHRK